MILLSRIKNSLSIDNPLSKLDKALGRWIRPWLYSLSPLLLAKYRYRLLKGKKLDLNNPETFDEKMLWLNIYWRHPLKTQCADKYAFRSYVAAHGYGHALPRLIAVYKSSSEIDFDTLPDKFVLKCTHGCKFNIICKDKSKMDVTDAKRKLDKWMRLKISKIWGEVHYAKIKPRIICEELLEDSTGDLPIDYKVYCFNGKAHCTMVCVGRDLTGSNAQFDFYDLEWKNSLPFCEEKNLAHIRVPKPAAYEEIIAVAEKLSKPFPFVRVDMYSINGKAVIGEMTFTPDGCIEQDINELGQNILGRLIKLPKL